MRITTGRVIDGKVVTEGDPLAEGDVVTVLWSDDKVTFDVSEEEEGALLAAIEQADRGQVVSWDELLAQLRDA